MEDATIHLDLTPLVAMRSVRWSPENWPPTILTSVASRYRVLIPTTRLMLNAIADRGTRMIEFKNVLGGFGGFVVRFTSRYPTWKALVLQSWECEHIVNLGVDFLWSDCRDLFYRDIDVFEELWAREERRRTYHSLQRIAKEYVSTMATLLEMGARSPESPLSLLSQTDRRFISVLLIGRKIN
jgi:hypothetical protein